MGGNDIHDFEIRPFADCASACELQELRYLGPCFTWTNKTIWSRIDRVFTNALWYGLFEYSQTRYLPNSLSDHTSMIIETPACPKPHRMFHFYDTWTKPAFLPIVKAQLEACHQYQHGHQLRHLLNRLRSELLQPNRNKFVDLKSQQILAKQALDAIQLQLLEAPLNLDLKQEKALRRDHYIRITSSALNLIKQQSKAEWISQGNDCTKYFFVKMKHRKAETFVYAINDDQGQHHTSFYKVAPVLHQYYHKLLGPSNVDRTPINPQAIQMGTSLTVESQLQLCKPFSEKDIKDATFSISNLKSPGPDGYNSSFFKTTWPLLGGLICHTVHRFFYTRRAQLLNSVIFGMYNYWAIIFILPQEVINQINQIRKIFLWSGTADYKRTPYISWSTTCTLKKFGGFGLKNLAAWNKACIAKLVKDILKHGPANQMSPARLEERDYTVKKGYLWLMGDQTNKPWSILIWSRTIIPRHSFTA
ncbi:hypothetical protein Cgig2_017470 [Carnegiea gigantea]|uniref:Uncharacterized protein n=1 Tax=Carnegiea gigantea TaxID=171969 RepID=A0A9Q1JIB4_9CARY|nr:hypothetical protein Cgig2_017470 [Carnegiea gigantea]